MKQMFIQKFKLSGLPPSRHLKKVKLEIFKYTQMPGKKNKQERYLDTGDDDALWIWKKSIYKTGEEPAALCL